MRGGGAVLKKLNLKKESNKNESFLRGGVENYFNVRVANYSNPPPHHNINENALLNHAVLQSKRNNEGLIKKIKMIKKSACQKKKKMWIVILLPHVLKEIAGLDEGILDNCPRIDDVLSTERQTSDVLKKVEILAFLHLSG